MTLMKFQHYQILKKNKDESLPVPKKEDESWSSCHHLSLVKNFIKQVSEEVFISYGD